MQGRLLREAPEWTSGGLQRACVVPLVMNVPFSGVNVTRLANIVFSILFPLSRTPSGNYGDHEGTSNKYRSSDPKSQAHSYPGCLVGLGKDLEWRENTGHKTRILQPIEPC
jgi:hypothetical protein